METNERPCYPANIIYDIFGGKVDLPSEPVRNLEYALKSLEQQESEMLMLKYRDNLTLEEIAEKFGLTEDETLAIIEKALRKLRHPIRSRYLRGTVELPKD